jgi:hypothetical protein
MAQDGSGKYFIKNALEANYEDVTSAFSGVCVLKAENICGKGKAVNLYNEQWVNSQKEDFLIAGEDGRIVRANPDVTITFIVGRRYAATNGWYILEKGAARCNTEVQTGVFISGAVCYLEVGEKIVTNKEVSFYKYNGLSRVLLGTGASYTNDGNARVTVYVAYGSSATVEWGRYTDNESLFDEQNVYDAFVDYMTSKDVWFASAYVNRQIHAVASADAKPKEVKIKRGVNSYIIGEITLHALEAATPVSIDESQPSPSVRPIEFPPCYYGFAEMATVSSIDDLKDNLTEDELNSITGDYTLTAAGDGYLWICVPNEMSVNRVEAYGFLVPMEGDTDTVVGYKCYRSSYEIKAGTYTINVNPNS